MRLYKKGYNCRNCVPAKRIGKDVFGRPWYEPLPNEEVKDGKGKRGEGVNLFEGG